MSQIRVCVTGAGGFIGTHLVNYLKSKGYWVRGVDIKHPRWSRSEADEFFLLDLRQASMARTAMANIDWVFALAADMGGAGHVFTGEHDMEIIRNNTLINVNTLEAARQNNIERCLFTSSACVYNWHLQANTDAISLNEEDVYPAEPDSIYGWEKLHAEHLCRAYAKATDMEIKIARLHNIFGPDGSYDDGREKLPAAACRKVSEAKLRAVAGETPCVEVWGDGQARRSFCYIDDCLEMLYRLMQSDHASPMNTGTDRSVSVDEVFDIIAEIAGVEIEKVHMPGPQGVRGRNADLTLCRSVLKYEPKVSLEDGLARTYAWIFQKVKMGIAS